MLWSVRVHFCSNREDLQTAEAIPNEQKTSTFVEVHPLPHQTSFHRQPTEVVEIAAIFAVQTEVIFVVEMEEVSVAVVDDGVAVLGVDAEQRQGQHLGEVRKAVAADAVGE